MRVTTERVKGTQTNWERKAFSEGEKRENEEGEEEEKEEEGESDSRL